MRLVHGALAAALLLAAAFGGPLVAQGQAYSVWDPGPLGLGHLAAVEGSKQTLAGYDLAVALGPLPSFTEAGLLLVEPQRAFTDAEVAALRAHVEQGGRALLLGSSPALADLLVRLRAGVTLGSGVYSPAYHKDAAFPVAEGLSGTWPLTLPRIVHGGQPLLRTGLAWEDLDGDVAPDLDEPVGSFPVAAVATLGAGQLLVVGSASPLTRDGWALGPGALLLDWLTSGGSRGILVDEAHRALLDPLGVGGMLAGAPLGWAVPLAALAGTLVWALRPRVHRKSEAQGPPGGARMRVAAAEEVGP